MPDTTWLQAVIAREEWDKLNARRAKLNLKWGQILLPAAQLYLDKVESGEIKVAPLAPTPAQVAAAKKAEDKAAKEAKAKADKAAKDKAAKDKAAKDTSNTGPKKGKVTRKTADEVKTANKAEKERVEAERAAKEKAEAASSVGPTLEESAEVAAIDEK